MKSLGLMICLAGTLAAIVYPPYVLMGQSGWAPIWGDIVKAFGHGVPVREHLDMQLLLLEVLVLNVVGVALILAGRR